MTDQPEPIPAATLVIFRDRPGAPPELMMVERSVTMNFAGGAIVFPGGRVDAADHGFAAILSNAWAGVSSSDEAIDTDDLAARIAAVRETIEEAGVAIGVSLSDLPEARRELYDGTAFAEVLRDHGGDPRDFDPSALVPFARWLPNVGAVHRVFDTRFYLARWPKDAPDPKVDGNENTRLFWASAQAVLDDADAGRAQVIFPTRRNLERLAQFDSYEEAVHNARAHSTDTIIPWVEVRDGQRCLCIPEGRGYPITAEPLTQAVRA